jgi:phosphatidylethanolamine/phosphatidyl-N-methylethanolamine N-methyltransferase
LLNWLANPARIGALLPSSSRLAAAMAYGVGRADCVLEIGAGTGAISRALAGTGSRRLVLVEPNERWAAGLQQRFPDAAVHAASLAELAPELLGALPDRTWILSSLPFRSLPDEVGDQARGILLNLLRRSPERRLVQFSYQPRPPFEAPADMVWKLRNVVLCNVPPAGVWELGLRRQGRHMC